MCFKAVDCWLWTSFTPITALRITKVVEEGCEAGSAQLLPHTPHTTDRQTGLGPSQGWGLLKGGLWVWGGVGGLRRGGGVECLFVSVCMKMIYYIITELHRPSSGTETSYYKLLSIFSVNPRTTAKTCPLCTCRHFNIHSYSLLPQTCWHGSDTEIHKQTVKVDVKDGRSQNGPFSPASP